MLRDVEYDIMSTEMKKVRGGGLTLNGVRNLSNYVYSVAVGSTCA